MEVRIPEIIDNLISVSTIDGLSANQGRILKNEHGELSELMTANKNSLVDAINEIKTMEQLVASELDDINGEVI